MSALSALLLALTCLGTLYYILSTVALCRHFGRSPTPNPQSPTPSVSVSVLKPVCGVGANARANFESHLRQDYPDCEVVFGVLDADDPATGLIGELGAALVIGSEIGGSNNKVRILHCLAECAGGEILVITDADTRVTPDFLSRITSPFADPGVGAVTCLYRGVEAETSPRTSPPFDGLRMRRGSLAAALEGLHMTCIFAPGVACAERLSGIDFGLGAAIAIRRNVLDEIGGFEGIVDYLADDFQLGRRTARAGYRVVLSDYVIEIVLGGELFSDVLARELRWSRTTKISRPAGHFGLVFTFGFAYAVGFLLSSGLSALGWLVVGATAVVRAVTAAIGARGPVGDAEFTRRIHLLPLRDLLSFGIWIAGYFSRSVRWRSRRLRLLPDGRMVLKDKEPVQ